MLECATAHGLNCGQSENLSHDKISQKYRYRKERESNRGVVHTEGAQP